MCWGASTRLGSNQSRKSCSLLDHRGRKATDRQKKVDPEKGARQLWTDGGFVRIPDLENQGHPPVDGDMARSEDFGNCLGSVQGGGAPLKEGKRSVEGLHCERFKELGHELQSEAKPVVDKKKLENR